VSDLEIRERIPRAWGGHMVGAICGRHPSLRPIHAYRHALGIAEEFERTPEMAAGLAFEPGLLRLAAERLGVKLRRVRPVFWSEAAWLRAAPDAEVQGRAELVSAKWVGIYNRRAWGAAESDRVPEYVAIQEHVYMGILGSEVSHVFASVGGGAPRYYAVPFRERLWSVLVERCLDFRARYVERQVPPPPDGSDAFDRYLAAEVRQVRADVRPATTEEVELCQQYRAARLDEKAAAKRLSTIKQELRLRIDGFARIETPDGTVTCKADARGTRSVRVPRKWDSPEETEE